MARARVVFDVNAHFARIANQASALVEQSAEIMRDEIRISIPDSPLPSGPGQPPHSPGPYREAWKSGRAKIKSDRIVAYTFNLSRASNGRSLADILERGEGAIHPHPHYRPAIPRARRRAIDLAKKVRP
jgi:hypothetical protein